MAMAGWSGEETNENYVRQLQALARGYLMRRNLQLVREEYEEVFSELEGNEKIFVCWPLDTLCLPKTQKDRPPKKISQEPLVLDNPTPTAKDKTPLHKKIVLPVQDDNLDVTSQKKNTLQEKCTAETQTSFTEDLHLKLSLGSSLLSPKTDTCDEDRRTPVQDHDEESFTDLSSTETGSHLVRQTSEDSCSRPIHPSSIYNDKTGLPLKSPDSSEGFEHSGKNSISSGRSEVNSSRVRCEITEVTRPTENNQRSEIDFSRSQDSSRLREKSEESEVKTDRSEVRSERSRVKSDRTDVSSDCSEINSDRSEVKTDRSDLRSERSRVKSNRSSINSGRSGRSKASPRSDRRSEFIPYSDRSEVSRHSDRRSEVIPYDDNREEDSLDRELIISPVTPRGYIRESSVLTNATSVWDSFTSVTDYVPSNNTEAITDDPDTLMEMRKSVAMELLWVQQAINSRKNYLKIKDQMKIPVSTS